MNYKIGPKARQEEKKRKAKPTYQRDKTPHGPTPGPEPSPPAKVGGRRRSTWRARISLHNCKHVTGVEQDARVEQLAADEEAELAEARSEERRVGKECLL